MDRQPTLRSIASRIITMNAKLQIILAILLFAFGNCQSGNLQGQDVKPPQDESRQAFQEKGDSSNDDESQEVTEEVEKQIADFFDELQVAFNSENGSEIPRLFSIGELVDSAEERGIFDLGKGERRTQLVKAIQSGFGRAAYQWTYMAWDSHEIRKIEALERDRFAVFVRHWHDTDEIYSKIRWWLVRTAPGEFKIYDFEDFDFNLRTSSLLGSALTDVPNRPAWLEPMRRLGLAFQTASPEDVMSNLDKYQTEVDDILAGDPPTEIRNFVDTLRVNHLLFADTSESNQTALKIVEEMHQAGDPPIAHYLKGELLMSLEQFEEAIESFENYSQRLGWDSDTYEMISDCHMALGDEDKSIEAAQLGLKDNHRSWGCLASLGLALPAERFEELKPHFEKLNFDEGALEYSMDWAIESENLELGRFLFGWLKEKHPESELIEYYNEVFSK